MSAAQIARIMFLTIDRTEEAPVDSHKVFESEVELLDYLGFDEDRCLINIDIEGNNDEPHNFDEDEIMQLLDSGFVYRDKREIFQIIRF